MIFLKKKLFKVFYIEITIEIYDYIIISYYKLYCDSRSFTTKQGFSLS